MSDCREIEPLVTLYVDDEALPEQRSVVEEHLTKCPPCRDHAESERAARLAVQRCIPGLKASAPAELRVRCASVCQSVEPEADQRMGALSRAARHWVPLSLAATLALAVGGVFLSGLNSRAKALAQELATDHVTCRIVLDRPAQGLDPRLVEAQLQDRYGWKISVPGSSEAESLTLREVRRCWYGDGEMAHFMYERKRRQISLFVLPDKEYAERELEILGHEAILWSDGGKTFALVGEEPVADLRRVAAYFRRATASR